MKKEDIRKLNLLMESKKVLLTKGQSQSLIRKQLVLVKKIIRGKVLDTPLELVQLGMYQNT